MPRTDVPVQPVPLNGSLNPVVQTAGDAANNHEVTNDGKTMVSVTNGDGSPHTATFVSVADQFGRTGDIVVPVAAGDTAEVGPLLPSIWNQPDGKLHVDLDVDTGMTIAAKQLSKLP